MKIQQVEKQTGVSAQNIRYYEREGLITPQRNPENSYRIYTREDVEQIRAIVFCRRLGISVQEIRQMLQAECTFQQCVETAMAHARAAEEEARAQAELCRSVLQQLQLDPDMEITACAETVLKDQSVRKLYAQVIPEEQRKQPRNRDWMLYLTAIPVVLIGVACVVAVLLMAQFRPNRNEMLIWITDPEVQVCMTYGEAAYSGDDLTGQLERLLLLGTPTEHLPWCGEPEDPVTVTLERETGTASIILWEADGKTYLIWQSPEREVKWTLLDHEIRILFRQIRSGILTSAG